MVVNLNGTIIGKHHTESKQNKKWNKF